MAKHLSRRDIQVVVELIRGWPEGKLTWPEICVAAEPLVGKLPTRQSLSAHAPIVDAYKTKKKGLKNTAPRKPRPASLNVAAARLAKLEAELGELKEKNRCYKQLFTVWQYNSYKYGLTERQLNQPLPKIDRERSDGDKR